MGDAGRTDDDPATLSERRMEIPGALSYGLVSESSSNQPRQAVTLLVGGLVAGVEGQHASGLVTRHPMGEAFGPPVERVEEEHAVDSFCQVAGLEDREGGLEPGAVGDEHDGRGSVWRGRAVDVAVVGQPESGVEERAEGRRLAIAPGGAAPGQVAKLGNDEDGVRVRRVVDPTEAPTLAR